MATPGTPIAFQEVLNVSGFECCGWIFDRKILCVSRNGSAMTGCLCEYGGRERGPAN